MNKQSLNLLEKVFAAEIEGRFDGVGLFQTKSILADKLEADGYIYKDSVVIGNC